MSDNSQPTTAPADGESVSVLIPGRPLPLLVELPLGCAGTTVGDLRDRVLSELYGADAGNGHFLRLIFRGKELRDPAAALAAVGLESGSSLHGMATAVLPSSQQQQSETDAARRAARAALSSAVGSIFGSEGGGGAAPETAGARSQLSQEDQMRLLQRETRRSAAHRQAAAPAGDHNETAVNMARPAGPSALHAEEAQTADSGRVRVTTLAGAEAPQETIVVEDEQENEAARFLVRLKALKWPFCASFIAGFLLGPVALFLPFEKIEVAGVFAGFLFNVWTNFVW